jgi:hypothetical protein
MFVVQERRIRRNIPHNNNNENETDITDLNHLIYAAATVITEKVTKPGKTVKSRRN